MSPEAVELELMEFEREYGPFLRSVKVESTKIYLETLEGVDYSCSVDEEGWKINGKVFPTSQAMMSSISPLFIQKWSEALMMRLGGL